VEGFSAVSTGADSFGRAATGQHRASPPAPDGDDTVRPHHHHRSTMKTGIVYVLANPRLPGSVTFSRCAIEDAADHLRRLNSEVAAPYTVEYIAKDHNPAEVEQGFRNVFAPYKVIV